MRQLLILISFFLMSQYDLGAQNYKNNIEISHRSFFFSKEHLVFQSWTRLPTIHYTRYLKNDRLGIQLGFNSYWKPFPIEPIYGKMIEREAYSFECSVQYRKFRKENFSLFLSSGLLYRESGEIRFGQVESIGFTTASLLILDVAMRLGVSSHWHFSDHWYLKANLDYRQHLVRLNKPDNRNKDFSPIYNYMIFDIGIGYGFGKGKKK